MEFSYFNNNIWGNNIYKMRKILGDVQERTKLINVLIGVAISSLFFISAFSPEIFKTNLLFVSQLILSIPILLSSSFFLSKTLTSINPIKLKNYSRTLFSIGYAFIINSIGIIVSILAGANIALLFFGVNILNALAYSLIMVKSENQSFSRRLFKDSIFIGVVILGGILQVI